MPKHKAFVDPIDIQVGKRLILARNMRSLSQERLGAAVGVTFQQIQKYETGTNRISVSRLVHLASSLRVPVRWFFEQMPEEQLDGEGTTLQEGYKFLGAFLGIKDKDRRDAVISLIHSLKD